MVEIQIFFSKSFLLMVEIQIFFSKSFLPPISSAAFGAWVWFEHLGRLMAGSSLPRASPPLPSCGAAANPRRKGTVLASTSAQNISVMSARRDVLVMYLCTLGDALEEHFRTEGFLLAEKKIRMLILTSFGELMFCCAPSLLPAPQRALPFQPGRVSHQK